MVIAQRNKLSRSDGSCSDQLGLVILSIDINGSMGRTLVMKLRQSSLIRQEITRSLNRGTGPTDKNLVFRRQHDWRVTMALCLRRDTFDQ